LSTILKALHRLEQDSGSVLDRPLREQIARPTHANRRWSSWLLTGGMLLLGFGAGAVALFLWFDPFASPPSPVPARDEIAQVAPKPAVTAKPLADPRVREVSPPMQIEAGLSDEALVSPVSVVERPVPTASAAGIWREPADDLAALSAFSAVPVKPVPIPSVVVQRTIWHPDSSQRTAEVRLKGEPTPLTLREGDAVGTLVVLRIEPSGVVFLNDRVEIHQRIGVR
jgi:hypothetical protein